MNRSIYTASNTQNLPGDLIRAEGAPALANDVAANEAYDGLGATFDFYHQVYERNSIDDEGLPLIATVHFGEDYDNAFWNGQQMVFGDGDGDLFQRFTISVDVIGHELTHGVTADESKLEYNGQSGALNESMSDVFGIMIKQYLKKQTAAQSDWLIGAGLLSPKVKGVALRSMKDPGTAFDDPQLGKDPQPGNMKDYVQTMEDNGGVHINSGIPNKAFYLAATKIGGNAWEKAGAIWYATQRDHGMRPNITFQRFAALTLSNAQRLYGAKGKEADGGPGGLGRGRDQTRRQSQSSGRSRIRAHRIQEGGRHCLPAGPRQTGGHRHQPAQFGRCPGTPAPASAGELSTTCRRRSAR